MNNTKQNYERKEIDWMGVVRFFVYGTIAIGFWISFIYKSIMTGGYDLTLLASSIFSTFLFFLHPILKILLPRILD